MGNKTFAMIKPDAMLNGYMGKIFDHVISAGFNILFSKLLSMN